ncbi:DDE-type integrase/transposase/recombinase [Legionella drancourtii]|uniref:DDE-type integrase/transposase/recombinase n=1 Tax=Legionella drancourtii TaxID=168933 RepID=UPI0038994D69
MDDKDYELDVSLQKRRNKKAAIRFLSRLLSAYPKPRVIITDKLRSYLRLFARCAKESSIAHIKGSITGWKMPINPRAEKKNASFVSNQQQGRKAS